MEILLDFFPPNISPACYVFPFPLACFGNPNCPTTPHPTTPTTTSTTETRGSRRKVLKWQVPLLLAKFNMHVVICCGLFWLDLLFILSVNKKGTTHHTTNHRHMSGLLHRNRGLLWWNDRKSYYLYKISLIFLAFRHGTSNLSLMEFLRNLLNFRELFYYWRAIFLRYIIGSGGKKWKMLSHHRRQKEKQEMQRNWYRCLFQVLARSKGRKKLQSQHMLIQFPSFHYQQRKTNISVSMFNNADELGSNL